MSDIFSTIWFGIKKSQSGWKYKVLFIVVFVTFFALFIVLPIIIESGSVRNLTYALGWIVRFLRFQDYLTITALSLLYALYISMQVYSYRQKKEYTGIGTAVGGGVGFQGAPPN